MYLGDTPRPPSKGLCPSVLPFFTSLLVLGSPVDCPRSLWVQGWAKAQTHIQQSRVQYVCRRLRRLWVQGLALPCLP